VFVVDKQGRLEGGLTSAGFLERTHKSSSRRMTAGGVARPCETVILPHASLDRALKLMAQGNVDYLPVVDDIQARKVLGVIFHKDLMFARSNASDEGKA
jgi:CBS domain-containing protein